MDREPLTAVFSIDYHLASLRGKAGHDGYDSWARSLASRSPLPDGFAPLELAKAVDRIAGIPTGGRERYRRHAAASCALGLVTAAHAHLPDVITEWRSAAARFFGLSDLQHVLGKEFTLLSPVEAYFAIAFIGSPCKVSNPKSWFSFDEFQVTTVGVEFDVDRELDDLKPVFDPRMWDVGAPESFQEADRIREIDRKDPVPGAVNPPPPTLPIDPEVGVGTSWSDPLYENAVGAVGGFKLIDFRNILRITYDVEPSISMEYHLCEGLSLDVAGSGPVLGGLDRDCGTAEAQVDPVSGLLHVLATKSIRVDQPAGLRDILNFGMAATLPFWFMNLVLLGICGDSSQ